MYSMAAATAHKEPIPLCCAVLCHAVLCHAVLCLRAAETSGNGAPSTRRGSSEGHKLGEPLKVYAVNLPELLAQRAEGHVLRLVGTAAVWGAVPVGVARAGRCR